MNAELTVYCEPVFCFYENIQKHYDENHGSEAADFGHFGDKIDQNRAFGSVFGRFIFFETHQNLKKNTDTQVKSLDKVAAQSKFVWFSINIE